MDLEYFKILSPYTQEDVMSDASFEAGSSSDWMISITPLINERAVSLKGVLSFSMTAS